MGRLEYDEDDLYQKVGDDVSLIEEWLEDCESAADIPNHNGGLKLSEWERDFLDSVRSQFDEKVEEESTHPLSGKQLAKLKEIWDRI